MVPGVLKTMEVSAVTVVSGAIISYGMVKYRSKSVGFIGSVLAFIIGSFIASYSTIDATSTRITKSATSY